MTIKQLIEATLKIPVLDEPHPLYNKCATYNSYFKSPGLVGNGRPNETIEYYQIDLWYKRRLELESAAEALFGALIEEQYLSIPTIEESCDPVTRLWRALIKFERIGGNDE